jgi:hypothetical protein
LKAIEVAAPDATFVGRHAADVIGVLRHKIGISIMQRAPHFVGVLLVDAKDDCLREGVLLAHELGKVRSDRLCSGPQRDDSFEVLRLVLLIRDRAAIPVALVSTRPPSGCIPLRQLASTLVVDFRVDPQRRAAV